MAPVPIEEEIRYLPLVVSASHIVGLAYLTFTIVRSLYHASFQIPPSQETRMRQSRRSRLAPFFAFLATLSLILAGRCSFMYAKLSYKVWANERGIDLPTRFYGDKGVFPSNENSTAIYIARWLTDTPVYMDAFEIVAEKARRFWWGQQIELATMSWCLLVSIEGRRRNIPLLWAYVGLAHLVNLSFAQNLFYLALIFTPAPVPVESGSHEPKSRYARIRDAIIPPKPPNWCPHPALLLSSYILNFVALFILPLKADTPAFANLRVLTRAFTFMPLIIPSMAPVSWGTVHPHPHTAYGAYSDLFRVISALGFFLHGKATITGLLYNAPDAHYHRHSVLLPFDTEKRGAWERTTTAFGKVLSATADHPVVQAIGWDVLMSALSLGLWAAVRALDMDDILTCTMPGYKKSGLEVPIPALKAEEADDASASETGTVRRRGRPAKSKLSIPAGDGAAASPRKRGKPRKAGAKTAEDDAYHPEPEESASVVEGDIVTAEGDLDWEATALTWGLIVVGGLGCGSAGVFGGECISR